MSERVRVMRLWMWIMMLAAVPALTGCSGFFVAPDNGGGGGTTGNIAYVANAASNTVAGFSIGTGTLTAVPNSPAPLGYSPLAAVVTPSNNFLYVAGPSAIYAYAIGTNGSLSAPSTGAAVAIINVAALDVSPDGNWLFGLDTSTTAVDLFQINNSTGALTASASTPYSIASSKATVVPKAIRISPNGSVVFAALGTAGDVVFTFNTTTGALVASQTLAVPATTSDNGLTIDSTTTHLYIARSGTGGGLAVFTIGASGALTSITGSPFTAGTGATSVVIDSAGKYVYVANRTDGTISGFTIGTTGALTTLTGSPYASGVLVTSLGVDSSGKYLLAASFGGSPDLSMYSFDAVTLGKLNLATSTATGTGTTGATSLALTH